MAWVERHMVGKEILRSSDTLPSSRPRLSIARARPATALLGALVATSACGGGQGPRDANVTAMEHVCSSCHGPEGRSLNPTFPNLAAQQEGYLTVQLKAFRDKTRADPHAHTYMWG